MRVTDYAIAPIYAIKLLKLLSDKYGELSEYITDNVLDNQEFVGNQNSANDTVKKILALVEEIKSYQDARGNTKYIAPANKTDATLENIYNTFTVIAEYSPEELTGADGLKRLSNLNREVMKSEKSLQDKLNAYTKAWSVVDQLVQTLMGQNGVGEQELTAACFNDFRAFQKYINDQLKSNAAFSSIVNSSGVDFTIIGICICFSVTGN